MKRVSLKNSEDIMLTDMWDVKENIFLDILKEASDKRLSEKTKIKVTRQKLIGDYNGTPMIGYQTLYYNFSTLKQHYKEMYQRDYSLENENKRQEEIRKFREYLDACKTGAINGIYKLIHDVETGKYF